VLFSYLLRVRVRLGVGVRVRVRVRVRVSYALLILEAPREARRALRSRPFLHDPRPVRRVDAHTCSAGIKVKKQRMAVAKRWDTKLCAHTPMTHLCPKQGLQWPASAPQAAGWHDLALREPLRRASWPKSEATLFHRGTRPGSGPRLVASPRLTAARAWAAASASPCTSARRVSP